MDGAVAIPAGMVGGCSTPGGTGFGDVGPSWAGRGYPAGAVAPVATTLGGLAREGWTGPAVWGHGGSR